MSVMIQLKQRWRCKMVFELNKNDPKNGDIRKRTSYCLIPLLFEKKIYWLHKVQIEEEYIEEDAITFNIEGGGWNIISVSVEKGERNEL